MMINVEGVLWSHFIEFDVTRVIISKSMICVHLVGKDLSFVDGMHWI